MHALLSDFHPPKVQLNSMSAVNNGEHDGGEAFVHIVGGEVQDGIELADLEGNGEGAPRLEPLQVRCMPPAHMQSDQFHSWLGCPH